MKRSSTSWSKASPRHQQPDPGELELPRAPDPCGKANQELDYDAGPSADYVDVVLVARLQTLDPELSEHENWGDILRSEKSVLEPEVEVISIEGAAEEIQGVEEIFL